MNNQTLIQFFEWYLPANASLWNEAKNKAENLSKLGITQVWLPPAYKGEKGKNDVGYGVYDMYDLGEFNQKGTVCTKYGTKDEYLNAIKTMQATGLKVYADVVFNHRLGADENELVTANVYDLNSRHEFKEKREILAHTKFNFENRAGKYSDFKWNHTHFDGCDIDDKTGEMALYLFENKTWDDQVDIEKGNYDYLMGADLDFNNEEVFDELINWGKWYLDFTKVDGFRIDAVKHINFPKIMQWFLEMKKYNNGCLFAVGEYWNSHLSALTYYLDKTANCIHLFDVPLHYNFYNASNSHGNFDMRKILDGTLLSTRPQKAVTIVDNHDTQPGQSLSSWINDWFKFHAYALILLRSEGLPCVFYGDLYGIPHSNIKPLGEKLEMLIKARANLAYGEQIDYFDNDCIVGFTRTGDAEHVRSGLAVILTDTKAGEKRMCMGEKFIGKTMVDILGNYKEKIIIGNDGCGVFFVNDGSVSVYALEN